MTSYGVDSSLPRRHRNYDRAEVPSHSRLGESCPCVVSERAPDKPDVAGAAQLAPMRARRAARSIHSKVPSLCYRSVHAAHGVPGPRRSRLRLAVLRVASG